MRVDLVTPIVVELAPADVARAQECARVMLAYNDARGWKDRALKEGTNRVDNFALGNYGELAVARWLGVPWRCANGAYAKSDVAGLHVRTTRPRLSMLQLYDATIDPDAGVFVLAIADDRDVDAGASVELAGWTTGRVGRLAGDLIDRGGGLTTWVSRARLTPMGLLRLDPLVAGVAS